MLTWNTVYTCWLNEWFEYLLKLFFTTLDIKLKLSEQTSFRLQNIRNRIGVKIMNLLLLANKTYKLKLHFQPSDSGFYIIFNREKLIFFQWKKWYLQGLLFSHCEYIKSVIITVWKLQNCNATSCIACSVLDLKEYCLKTKEKKLNTIQWDMIFKKYFHSYFAIKNIKHPVSQI